MGHNQMQMVWEPPQKAQKRAGKRLTSLDVSGCQLELGAPGGRLFRYPKFKTRQNRCGSRPRIQKQSGSWTVLVVKWRALPTEMVGELLKRLDAFGRELELGRSGVGLFAQTRWRSS